MPNVWHINLSEMNNKNKLYLNKIRTILDKKIVLKENYIYANMVSFLYCLEKMYDDETISYVKDRCIGYLNILKHEELKTIRSIKQAITRINVKSRRL